MAGRCWRVVEAQHVVSTLKLVDTLEEQALLEELLEDTKPPLPRDCQHLHYLLATPFRYGAPYPRGSRFRKAGLTPGVFYASQTASTAIVEMTFYRLLFFAESPDTPWPVNAVEHTAFAIRYRASAGIDLTAPPLNRDDAEWSHRTDYAACQDLAETARRAKVDAIRYRSVRDPQNGINVALLTCATFTSRAPVEHQTWRLYLGPRGAAALCDSPSVRIGFDAASFAADERLATLRWNRA